MSSFVGGTYGLWCVKVSKSERFEGSMTLQSFPLHPNGYTPEFTNMTLENPPMFNRKYRYIFIHGGFSSNRHVSEFGGVHGIDYNVGPYTPKNNLSDMEPLEMACSLGFGLTLLALGAPCHSISKWFFGRTVSTVR